MSLIYQLAGAKLVHVDEKRGLIMAWFGGHGVHAYDEEGTEVSFWNVGDFAKSAATEGQIRQTMIDHAKRGNYP